MSLTRHWSDRRKMKKPIPPLSVVVLKKLWPHARKQGHEVGEKRRIGYYSRQDGLDCVWLVNPQGEGRSEGVKLWGDPKGSNF